MVTFIPWQKEEKTKKLSQFLKAHILKTPGTISLKYEVWGTDGGGYFHSKNNLVL